MIKEMLEDIRKEAGLKKNKRMAHAIACDLQALTGSIAISEEGGTHRKPRFGGSPTPGYFIRTTVYKVAWETFLDKRDAEQVRSLFKKALNHNSSSARSEIKAVPQDFGILETLKLLEERGSKLEHVTEVYKYLSVGIKFGI